MPEDVLIQCENVGKIFCRDLKKSLYYGIRDIISDLFFPTTSYPKSSGEANLRDREFWANRDISFEVRRGECLGLVGRNGAGKTTLLKMLSGLIRPDTGRITMRGQIGTLIALGAGFNPILTGRENVLVNGAVLGVPRMRIRNKLDEIVEFSELQDFIDTPVQNYSSGMKVRLGFSIATILQQPDVLLLDEVLAVGDAAFRSKCFNRISELKEKAAVIFVSHNVQQVSRICTSAIHMNAGVIKESGSVQSTLNSYIGDSSILGKRSQHGSGEARVTELSFVDHHGRQTNAIEFGKPFQIILQVESEIELPSLVIDIGIRTMDEQLVAEINNFVLPTQLSMNASERKKIVVAIDSCQLNVSKYAVSVFAFCGDMIRHFDWQQNHSELEVYGEARVATAGYQLQGEWSDEPLP